jgi:DNA modification methylase
MIISYDNPEGIIYQGDALSALQLLLEKSVNCCVTSPPYWGLRDYGEDGQLGLEPTPEQYVENMVKVFDEVGRVLRDDGTLWLNLGDSYNGSGPSGGMGKQYTNVGSQGTTVKNAIGLKQKDLIGIPWRVAFALQTAGWYLRQDIIWHKPNPMPESVKDRCTKAHEYIFLFSKNQRYYFDNEAIREPVKSTSKWKTPDGWDTSKGDGGHGSYHKNGREKGYTGYRPKGPQKGYKRPNKKAASVGPMARGKEGFNHQFADPERVWDDGLTRNKRSVWTVSTKPFSGAHFATFPPDLILPCILAGCPEGGTVLDPFFGSGTTGIVAYQQDRKFIGIELSEKYLSEIVIPRIKKETEQLKLFSVC